MAIVLAVQTGDVTSDDKGTRTFRISVERPPVDIALSFGEATGMVAADDWRPMLDQIRQQELVKRHTPDLLAPPLGEVTVLPILREIRSTPTYQLFLAGIDIAEAIDLISESDVATVLRRFDRLEQSVPSVTGAGGIFLLPTNIIPAEDGAAIEELLNNNKLCRATLEDTEDRRYSSRRYYVPYATPIGFISPVSARAAALWDAIRNYYYAFRYPM